MNDAGLMEGLWIDDLYSFSHALQAIRNGDENVLNASGLQPLKTVTQKLAPSFSAIHMPRTSRVPSVRSPIPR